MEEPPARKPTQAERHRVLRQQARAGDPVAQAQVEVLNARNRASAAKAKAEGRGYRYPEYKALRQAEKRAAAVAAATPEQAERARQRQDRQAAAQRKRDAAAAAPPKPVLSAEEQAAQARERNLASNRASYRALRGRVAAGDAEARAKYEQRLTQNRQRGAAKAVKLTPEQRRLSARQGALKRWGKRAAPTE